ncbi:MAG: flavodoxin family protein, partial [Methanosarcinales archaeon]
NKCVLKDDWNELAEKIAESDALVVGSPTYYGNVSAFTKAFMERLYAFRHINLLTRGKLAASVGVGVAMEQFVMEYLANVLRLDGMEYVGGLAVKGVPCCFACGAGETCEFAVWNAYSVKMTGVDYHLEEAYKDNLTILPENDPYVHGAAIIKKPIKPITENQKVMYDAKKLGELIGQKLRELK